MDPQVYKAARLGDITLLQQVVIEDSSRLMKQTPQNNTTLHVAVRFGHTEFVEEVYSALLQHNSSLEGNTEYNKTLSFLSQVNSEVIPEKLRMRNMSFHTALQEAMCGNDHEMVKLLAEADPDFGHPNYDADAEGYGESPIYLAARDGHLDILNQIFLICPSLSHGGPHGRTALHVVVVERRLDNNGRTTVYYAVSDGAFRIVQQLQRRNKPSGDLKIVKQLLRHDGSSAYKLDKDGLSPLHIDALESSNQDVHRDQKLGVSFKDCKVPKSKSREKYEFRLIVR
ncbi:serine/threonine-protein phosphatase 6 regulatory ankyrin repeat subunit B-like [Macadamia integrifolia]|uniref:serine/threonine-protein phosphatase 6 regulatory ankyrin repeat subunit B-like n=1 Tax=Macadamia integrifolia TaxID=60698 RepID=UPI001C4E4E41|nr:serine/threonine-protein phosphatase 6 regulatory ankyrin repeat subunit B-like [Macadamia integrifolia]